MTEAKKTVNTLVSNGNLTLDTVIEGLVYDLKFKSVSDGGSSNDATFTLKDATAKLDFTGVTIEQLIDRFALGQARIDIASEWRRMTKAEAENANGNTWMAEGFVNRAKRARPTYTADQVVERISVDNAKLVMEALQAKMAGAPLTQEQLDALKTIKL